MARLIGGYSPGVARESDAHYSFPIRVDPWWRPVLWLFGVTPARSLVTLEGDAIGVRFGFWQHHFPREQILAARRVRGSLLWGIGWHTDLRRRLVVNGSLAGMVELDLAAPEPYRLLGLPGRFTQLSVSLEQPDAFLRALNPDHAAC